MRSSLQSAGGYQFKVRAPANWVKFRLVEFPRGFKSCCPSVLELLFVVWYAFCVESMYPSRLRLFDLVRPPMRSPNEVTAARPTRIATRLGVYANLKNNSPHLQRAQWLTAAFYFAVCISLAVSRCVRARASVVSTHELSPGQGPLRKVSRVRHPLCDCVGWY